MNEENTLWNGNQQLVNALEMVRVGVRKSARIPLYDAACAKLANSLFVTATINTIGGLRDEMTSSEPWRQANSRSLAARFGALRRHNPTP